MLTLLNCYVFAIKNTGQYTTEENGNRCEFQNHKCLSMPRNAILNPLYVGLLVFCGIMHSWHPSKASIRCKVIRKGGGKKKANISTCIAMAVWAHTFIRHKRLYELHVTQQTFSFQRVSVLCRWRVAFRRVTTAVVNAQKIFVHCLWAGGGGEGRD